MSNNLQLIAASLGWGNNMTDREIAQFIINREHLLRKVQSMLNTHLSDAPTAELAMTERINLLNQQHRWADYLAEFVDYNHGSGISDVAWNEFLEKEHETLPVVNCLCIRCREAREKMV